MIASERVQVVFLIMVLMLLPESSISEDIYDTFWYGTRDSVAIGFDRYEISEGIRKPSDLVEIKLFFDKETDVNWTLEYKLIRVDGDHQIIYEERTNIEKIYPPGLNWSIQLPLDNPVLYRLGVLVREGEWDFRMLVSNLRVVSHEIIAEMYIDREIFSHGENPKIKIINRGSAWLVTGQFYWIERSVYGEWVRVPWRRDKVWLDVAHLIPPGDDFAQRIELPSRAGTGRYRVCKTVEADYTAVNKKLCSEFTMLKNPDNQSWMYILIFLAILGFISLYIMRERRVHPRNSSHVREHNQK